MTHYVIVAMDNPSDQEVGDLLNVIIKNGGKTIYQLGGESLDIVDIKAYLHLVEGKDDKK